MMHPKKTKKHDNGGGVSVVERQHPTPLGPSDSRPQASVASAPGSARAAATWRRQQRITALWSNNEGRSSWAAVRGVGWRRLAATSDSANMALTVLASQALQTGRTVDYREDGETIHEIYLW